VASREFRKVASHSGLVALDTPAHLVRVLVANLVANPGIHGECRDFLRK